MLKQMLPKVSEKERELKLVRAELNIERWSPMFATSQYKGRSREIYRQLGDGKLVGVIVGKHLDHRGNLVEVGVLTVPALKVFYGLVKLWEVAGKPKDEPVSCTMPQLCEVLSKDIGGKEYEYLRVMLESLKHIPIRWIGSFYQKDIDRLETILDDFHILTTLQFYEERLGDRLITVAFRYKFHERILCNLLNNYTKPLNLDVIINLKKELAVLLYCHIDLIMADKDRYERRTKELFEDLAIEGEKYQYPSARRQNLEPALKELVGVRLSTGILKQAFLQKTRNGKDLKAVFRKEPFPPPAAIYAEVRVLVEDILAVTQDEHSRPFYIKLAKLAADRPRLQDLIYRCLSEVKYEAHEGLIRTTKGAVFTDKIKRYCRERGIDLGLKGSQGFAFR